MKLLQFKPLLLLLIATVLISGCNNTDDPPKLSPFVGNYVISQSVLVDTLYLSSAIPGFVLPSIPPGTPITPAIQAALLGSVTCDTAVNSYIELHADQSMVLSCKGENPLDAGTWEEVSATELNLNMNSTAVPTAPTGITLAVTNIVTTNSGITGTTSVPLPKDMFETMVPPGVLDPNVPVYMVKFTLTLDKK